MRKFQAFMDTNWTWVCPLVLCGSLGALIASGLWLIARALAQ